MIYNLTFLPSIFEVDSSITDSVGEILESHGLACNRALILTGSVHSSKLAARVQKSIETPVHVHQVAEFSEAEVVRIKDVIEQHRVSLLIAVGGGGVVDVAKRVSRLYSVPVVVIPTVVSNDGLMSPISVLETSAGRSESLPSAMPVGVIADLDVIMAAPRRHLEAAGGDLLSNLSATSDWKQIAMGGRGPKINDVAFHLARNAAETIVHSSDCDLSSLRFVRSLVVSQIYSGMAMALAGNSRPCSGPEHLVSHAMDELKVAPHLLHGIQVGSICMFMLHLLGELDDQTLHFGRTMNIPLDWTSLSPAVTENVPQIVARSRLVRPDRRTLLDDMSDSEIIERSFAFRAITGKFDRPALTA